MVLSEPVSEALLPVYNQLSTLKRCLLEVKNTGGVNSVRDMYPYSLKVSASETMCPFHIVYLTLSCSSTV